LGKELESGITKPGAGAKTPPPEKEPEAASTNSNKDLAIGLAGFVTLVLLMGGGAIAIINYRNGLPKAPTTPAGAQPAAAPGGTPPPANAGAAAPPPVGGPPPTTTTTTVT